MRIEALENIKDGRYVVTVGDILTVEDEYGFRWCGAGWAKDVAGVVSTGERVVQGVKLAPKKPVHTASNSEV